MISRRSFLALTGGAIVSPSVAWAADEEDDNQVPALLDHILLGCNDLDRGIELVEQNVGVRPAIGGVHPGRGTRNALLSLGERRYLEIIAPDPAQLEIVHYPQLRSMTDARLIGWAVHPPDIAAVANQLRENKIAFTGPADGSRKRPDGRVLTWKTVNLADDRHGLLPFFMPKGRPRHKHGLSFELHFLQNLFPFLTLVQLAAPHRFASCRAAAGTCYTLKPILWLLCTVRGGL